MNHVLLINKNWQNKFVRVPAGKKSRVEFVHEGTSFRLSMANFYPSRGKFGHPCHYIGIDWIASFYRLPVKFRTEPDVSGSCLRIRGNTERAEEELMLAYLKYL